MGERLKGHDAPSPQLEGLLLLFVQQPMLGTYREASCRTRPVTSMSPLWTEAVCLANRVESRHCVLGCSLSD